MRKKAAIGTDHLMDYLEKRLILHGPDIEPQSTTALPTPQVTSQQPVDPSVRSAIAPLATSSPSSAKPAISQLSVLASKPRPKSNEVPAVQVTKPYLTAQGRSGSAPEIIVSTAAAPRSPLSGSAHRTKDAAINTIMNDTRPKLANLHRTISNSKSIADLMPLAKSVRELRKSVELAKNLVPSVNAPSVTQEPGEDKLETFKKTTSSALEYVALTMKALMEGLDKSQDETEILELARATTKINSSLPSVQKANA